jgi:hypothetical protein
MWWPLRGEYGLLIFLRATRLTENLAPNYRAQREVWPSGTRTHQGRPSPRPTYVTRRKERENGEEVVDDVASHMYAQQHHVRQVHHQYGTRSLGTSSGFVIVGLQLQNHDSLIKPLPQQLQLATDPIFSFLFKFFPFSSELKLERSKMALAASCVYLERESAPGGCPVLTATHQEADGDGDAIIGSVQLDYEFVRDGEWRQLQGY